MRRPWVLFLPLLLFSSCEMALRLKDQIIPSPQSGSATGVLVSYFPDQKLPETVPVRLPTVILNKGNKLVYGLPGFGENAIRAITGEYKIELPENTAGQTEKTSPLVITAWLTSEFMFISPELWSPRVSLQTYHAMERRDDQGLHIISGLPNTVAGQEKWTILFSIPGETINAGITDAYTDRIIRAWTSRLSYYISISQTDIQVSLPAVVTF